MRSSETRRNTPHYRFCYETAAQSNLAALPGMLRLSLLLLMVLFLVPAKVVGAVEGLVAL